MRLQQITLVALGLVLVLGGAWLGLRHQSGNADDLILLIPDQIAASDSHVRLWLDAASEEGLHIEPVHDSEFVRPISPRNHCAGVILPDEIHKEASDVFVGSIQNYVANGGNLMLVYDAGTLSNEDATRRSGLAFRRLPGSTMRCTANWEMAQSPGNR
jgi:hypothetical protein